MRYYGEFISITLICLLMGVGVAAQTTTSVGSPEGTSSTSTSDVSTEKPEVGLKGKIESAYSMNTVQAARRGSQQKGTFTLEALYSLKGGHGIGGAMSVSDKLNSPDSWKSENTMIFYATPKLTLNEVFNIEQRVGAWAPTKTEVYEKESYRGAVHLETSLNFKTKFLGKEVVGFYRPRFLRNFHRYTQKASGQFNTEYTVRNRLYASIQVLKWLGFSGLVQLQNARAYSGSWKDGVRFAEAINFSVTESLGISLSHDNAGSTFESDGTTSNVAIYDTEQSIYSGSLIYSF